MTARNLWRVWWGHFNIAKRYQPRSTVRIKIATLFTLALVRSERQ